MLLLIVPSVVLALVMLVLGVVAFRKGRPEDVPEIARAIADWFRWTRK
jgi:hypothetical protein